MRIARRALLSSLIASAAAPAVLRLARAAAPALTLKLHHPFSSVSCGHDRFLVPWARKVEMESDGHIRIDIFPSMQLGGAPAQLFDQARAGLADIVWAAPGNTPGRFTKIEAFELPFVPSRRALVNSKALEDYAAQNLQDEFRDIHPISFSCRDSGVFHATRAIRSLADLKGLRLHVPNRLAGEAVSALGANAVNAPIAQVPMAIAGHAIDGCLDPWDVVLGLKLHDLLRNHADFADASLSTATFVLAMNKSVYDRLPRELKTVIDNNSGQVAAGMAGAMWDLEAKAVADMVRERADPITTLTEEEVAHGRKATEPVIAAWLKQMKERKVDGVKLIASARASLAKYADQPEPQAPQRPQAKATTQPQQPQPKPAQPLEPKVAAQPPVPQVRTTATELPKVDAPAAVPAPIQAKAAATTMPKVNAPAAPPAPLLKRTPLHELDIPL